MQEISVLYFLALCFWLAVSIIYQHSQVCFSKMTWHFLFLFYDVSCANPESLYVGPNTFRTLWVSVGSTAYSEEEDFIPCLASFSVWKYPTNVHKETLPGKGCGDCTQIQRLSNLILLNIIFKWASPVSKGVTTGKSTEDTRDSSRKELDYWSAHYLHIWPDFLWRCT